MLRYVTESVQRWRDRLRRRLAIWIWDRPNRQDGVFQDRVVFIRWDAKLGDTIVLSWVLRALERQRPDLEIVVITGESLEDLYRWGYGIDSVYRASKRHGFKSLRSIVSKLERPRYVVHLSMAWRARDLWFVHHLKPRHVVGLDDELRMVDVKLGQRSLGLHFADKLVPWLEQIGVDVNSRRYSIPRIPEAGHRVDLWWPKGKVIGVCPYGASRKKYLNDVWFESIVRGLLANQFNVVVLVLPDHHAVVQNMIHKHAWQQRVFLNPDKSSVYDLFEQVARCDGVVSVDTAVVHIAVGFERPLVAIYNSSGIEFDHWHPNSSKALVLRGASDLSQIDNGLSQMELARALQYLRCNI
ncbi:glycosyltransferase family 9 protein [Orrella daihaiensis]|uniref:Glycosyltransferase family 9 protein n=1 Tax=Orrella daihaiensis TaxID=2782176 RepID=A0ABY4AN73_9BURK|nr:glycosyltransferase family 9 protein [Orrella daihaiensis]UOD51488.1 glycosyltransferase family 9 protein [Orrella daihaiensis]